MHKSVVYKSTHFFFTGLFKENSDSDLSDYDNLMDNEDKSPIQESQNGSSVDDVRDQPLTLKLGSLVQIQIKGKKEIGIVRWIGETGSPKHDTAGLEMVNYPFAYLIIKTHY